ncbi:glycoside hydrolase family 127 protein [Puia dinghuensis]|uniref:Glycosyl hydrolase n=1 Tax=Puia dinghuensis TaxID=1792502 RepID=A0A8J2UCU8_9BACT|nr:glycoside hydrolase family 127 protein [Puia dinghuensis]GGA99665.1 glycosyl hydrolase [Puia dinghuensis]
MKQIVWLFATITTITGMAQSYVPEYNNKEVKQSPVVAIKAYPFDLKDVRLLDGPFKQAMEADARYLKEIDPDRLLSEFRRHSGLDPKAEKYGGWESSGLAGHTLGHYLSACSMQYAATGDTAFLHRVSYIVSELAVCQQARNTGYIGAIPREDTLWAEVAAGHIRSHGFDLNGAWSPWYTVHKVMAGLLDAYLYCGNARALAVEKGMADWTSTIVGNLPDSSIQKMLACEYGGMNDVLANTYALTGDRKYLLLSYKFHDKRILDSLSRDMDDLAGKHSNTQIPKVIGCARRYELTNDDRDRRIAESFWAIIVKDHSYATGGNSDYEYLGPPRQLNNELTENTTETCNTYNMLKLTRHLFAWHPSAMLMDYYEKALYNHILASQNHATGMMTYFVPLRMGGHKEYSDPFNTFTCCVGSGMENHVKYGESIYSRGSDGSLYVNLFISSRLNWREKSVTIQQLSGLPGNDRVTLTITAARPTTFTLRVRKPHWATNSQSFPVGEDGYITITRTWKGTETIDLHFQENFYTESIPDNPNRIALFYGPVLLAGELGNKEPDPVKGIPVLVASGQDPNQWVHQAGTDDLVFHTTGAGQPAEITLIPFNRTENEYYSVYWDYFTPAAWTVQQQKYEEERKKEQELEEKTIDRLRIGEMQPERDHSFAGENLHAGEEHGKKWLSTDDGGWFSFTMKVDSAAANTILCSYWGDDHRGRIFDIQVDGQTIATQNLGSLKQSKFYEISYPVPADLTRGKQIVTVKFAAHSPRTSVGPVSGTISMIHSATATDLK